MEDTACCYDDIQNEEDCVKVDRVIDTRMEVLKVPVSSHSRQSEHSPLSMPCQL